MQYKGPEQSDTRGLLFTTDGKQSKSKKSKAKGNKKDKDDKKGGSLKCWICREQHMSGDYPLIGKIGGMLKNSEAILAHDSQEIDNDSNESSMDESEYGALFVTEGIKISNDVIFVTSIQNENMDEEAYLGNLEGDSV